MKRIGRPALLVIATTCAAVSGLAYLATNKVDPSYAGSTTIPFSIPTAPCYGPGTLAFKGNGNDSTSPAQGGVKCKATMAENMVVTASIISGSASTCSDITFSGSPLSGPVDVPLSDAVKPGGAVVVALAANHTFDGSAQLTGCSVHTALSVQFTLTVA